MSEKRPTGWEGADRWFSPEAGGTGGGGEVDVPPGVPVCAVCGAELETDQTYCLECGSPTALAPRLRRGTGRTAAILAGAMVVLGLGAGALAYAVVQDDAGGASAPASTTGAPIATVPNLTTPPVPETAPTTGSLPTDTSVTTPDLTAPDTASTATGFDTVTGPSSVPDTSGGVTTASSPGTTTASGVDGTSDWPVGRTAWTAILASTRSESDARSAKTQVAGAGDPAGVLFSTDFAELRPGYWVVFSGTYDSRNTAIAQAAKLQPDFPSAYARRIEG